MQFYTINIVVNNTVLNLTCILLQKILSRHWTGVNLYIDKEIKVPKWRSI